MASKQNVSEWIRGFRTLEMQYCSGEKWCRRGESNPRPRDYETLALPLSYAGFRQPFMLRIRLQRCQGLPRRRRSVPRDQGNTPGLTSDDVVKHQVSEITLAERNKRNALKLDAGENQANFYPPTPLR